MSISKIKNNNLIRNNDIKNGNINFEIGLNRIQTKFLF